MQKTKLGIAVGLVGALMYASAYFGGYLLTFLLAGYILLCEDNAWLKRTSVKAVALMVAFSALSLVVGLIPDVIGLVDSVFNVFGGYFTLNFVSKLVNLVYSVINLAKTLLFLLLGVKALNQGTVLIPVIDGFVNKYMN